jgi:hypothetical protein
MSTVANREVEKENYFEGSFVRKRSLINWHAPIQISFRFYK